MRELELDYQRNSSKLTKLGVAVCVVAAVLFALILIQYSQVSGESQMLEENVRQFESKAASHGDGLNVRRDPRSLAAEVKQANHVLKMLGMKWDSIFAAVAAAHGEGVALLSFAPEPEKRNVKISAEAKNFSIMLEYVKRLEDQPALDAVYLQSHNLQSDNPQKPVRFVITADWLDK